MGSGVRSPSARSATTLDPGGDLGLPDQPERRRGWPTTKNPFVSLRWLRSDKTRVHIGRVRAGGVLGIVGRQLSRWIDFLLGLQIGSQISRGGCSEARKGCPAEALLNRLLIRHPLEARWESDNGAHHRGKLKRWRRISKICTLSLE